MIGYLKGDISHVFAEYCFINVNGVGYRVFVPESTRRKLHASQQALLYTYLNVREDAMLLFGFISQEEYELFMKLIAVTGIGPKAALLILSAVSAEEFCIAIGQRNLALLTKIPGIGKKTAERLVLELKDKLGSMGASASGDSTENDISSVPADKEREVMTALTALGYSQSEVLPVLRRIGRENMTLEETIKAALREFARGK